MLRKVVNNKVGIGKLTAVARQSGDEYLQTPPIPAPGRPPDIISHTVWLYHRFNLSHRDIEDLLAERGIGGPTARSSSQPFRHNGSSVFMLPSTIYSTWEGTWLKFGIIEISGQVRLGVGQKPWPDAITWN